MSSIPKLSQRESLTIRILPEDRGLIDRAARVTGRNRTDFILDAARHAATDALLDRTLFTLDEEAFAEFIARLDEAPHPNERLKKALRTPAPWDASE